MLHLNILEMLINKSMNVEHIITVIKLDIKTNIMANNKTITIEHIIGKIDNDFNPDGSDWIPRVPAWCVDAMNELKVLRKVDKKMKLTVINKIAKSKCCLIDDGLKVYDSNGCEVPRADGSKYRCSDTESTTSSTGVKRRTKVRSVLLIKTILVCLMIVVLMVLELEKLLILVK